LALFGGKVHSSLRQGFVLIGIIRTLRRMPILSPLALFERLALFGLWPSYRALLRAEARDRQNETPPQTKFRLIAAKSYVTGDRGGRHADFLRDHLRCHGRSDAFRGRNRFGAKSHDDAGAMVAREDWRP
jgi:hypothetical protein